MLDFHKFIESGNKTLTDPLMREKLSKIHEFFFYHNTNKSNFSINFV